MERIRLPAPISRAQLVTMVVRGIESRKVDSIVQPPVMQPYPGTVGDFDPGHAPFMRLAEYNGLLDGLVGFDRGWDPWLLATRGEVAQILWNVLCFRGQAPGL